MNDIPPREGAPATENEQNKVMHVALLILGGIQIMATYVLESLGQKLVGGNNCTISLNPGLEPGGSWIETLAGMRRTEKSIAPVIFYISKE